MSDRLSFHTAAGYCDYVDTVSVNSVCVAGCSMAGKINAQGSGKWAATIKMWTSNLLIICPTLSLPHPWLCANHQLSANLLSFSSSSHSALGVNQFKRSTIILDLKIHEDDGSWVYETLLQPLLWMMHGRGGQPGCCPRPFIQQRKLTTGNQKISKDHLAQALSPGRLLREPPKTKDSLSSSQGPLAEACQVVPISQLTV